MFCKIGAFAVVPVHSGVKVGLLGIECAKGRGLILPGGTYEPSIDASYHHTAKRELYEETEVTAVLEDMRYLMLAPDGGNYMTYAFLCPRVYGTPQITEEGKPTIATWDQLCDNKYFGSYYRVLRDIIIDKSPTHSPYWF